MERALLAIDIFPRCALLLSLFENFPLEDAATLLNEDPKLVAAARTIGLVELVRNLAQSPDSTVPPHGATRLPHPKGSPFGPGVLPAAASDGACLGAGR